MTNISAGQWQTSKSLPDSFFRLPWKVYSDHPNWLPENQQMVRRQFSSENHFFSHNNCAWVGMADDVARLAGFFYPDMRIDGETIAFFGFWETGNDLEVSRSLFEEFESWARGKGVQKIFGPVNFSTYYDNRLRTDNFGEGCYQGEPYNPQYYPQLLEAMGYCVHSKYKTWITENPAMVGEFTRQGHEKAMVELVKKFDIQTLTPDIWIDCLEQLYPVTDQIFKQNFAYTPISAEAYKAFCGPEFVKKFCPKSSIIAFDRESGDIAGFFLSFPDYSPLLRQGNPNPIDANDINYDEHFQLLPKPRMVLSKTAGIMPQYRKHGLYTAMAWELNKRAVDYYEHLAGCMAHSDNPSVRIAERFGMGLRNYALYSKKVA
jgi:hypothetical protein